MGAGDVLERVFNTIAPAIGQIALALSARRGIPKPTMKQWVAQFRAAADELEKLL